MFPFYIPESTPDPEEVESLHVHSTAPVSQEPHVTASLGGGVGGAGPQDRIPRGSDTFCLVPGRLSIGVGSELKVGGRVLCARESFPATPLDTSPRVQ